MYRMYIVVSLNCCSFKYNLACYVMALNASLNALEVSYVCASVK